MDHISLLEKVYILCGNFGRIRKVLSWHLWYKRDLNSEHHFPFRVEDFEDQTLKLVSGSSI